MAADQTIADLQTAKVAELGDKDAGVARGLYLRASKLFAEAGLDNERDETLLAADRLAGADNAVNL